MPKSTNDNLFKEADMLNINPQDENFIEFEKRVLNAKQDKREDKLFTIATVSAIASVISALAAWFAVLK